MMGVFVRQDGTEFGPQSDIRQAVAKSGSVGAITPVNTANGNGWWTTNAGSEELEWLDLGGCRRRRVRVVVVADRARVPYRNRL